MNLTEAIQAASIALQALDDRISAMERRQAEIDAAFAKLAPVKSQARYFRSGMFIRKIKGGKVYARNPGDPLGWFKERHSPKDIMASHNLEIPASEGEA